MGYQDFQKGLTAYQQGNFVMAFNVFKPLAEQGDTSAAYNIAQMSNKLAPVYYNAAPVCKYIYLKLV